MDIAVVGTIANSLLGFRLSFLKKLVAEGHVVYALAMDFTPDTKAKLENVGVIPIDYHISRFGLNPFLDITNTIKLSRILSSLHVDLVFCYFVKPVIFGTLAARMAGVPRRIGMLEGLGYPFTAQPNGESIKQKLIRLVQVMLYKVSMPLLDCLIVLNPDDKKDLVDRYHVRARDVAILGGIGLNLADYPETPLSSTSVNFTFIGRLLKEKGIEGFLEAAAVVKQQFPDAVFTVLGELEKESSSSIALTRFNELCDQGVIEYHGQVNNIYDWLAKCHVFVLPSYREGVPRSTQEAMAVGRAVITTDVPGCRETVEPGRNGLLIAPHSTEALVEAMVYFLEHQDKIKQMGDQSHQMAVEKFDETKVNDTLYQLLVAHC